jgi:hypothetical protein
MQKISNAQKRCFLHQERQYYVQKSEKHTTTTKPVPMKIITAANAMTQLLHPLTNRPCIQILNTTTNVTRHLTHTIIPTTEHNWL